MQIIDLIWYALCLLELLCPAKFNAVEPEIHSIPNLVFFLFSCFHNDTKNMFLNLVLNKLIRADDLLSTNDMSMVVVCTKFDFLILIYFIFICFFVHLYIFFVSLWVSWGCCPRPFDYCSVIFSNLISVRFLYTLAHWQKQNTQTNKYYIGAGSCSCCAA